MTGNKQVNMIRHDDIASDNNPAWQCPFREVHETGMNSFVG